MEHCQRKLMSFTRRTTDTELAEIPVRQSETFPHTTHLNTFQMNVETENVTF